MPPLGDPTVFSNLPSKAYIDSNDITGTFNTSPPDWQERHYVMKSAGQQVGIFKGPVDNNITANFAIYQPSQAECPMLPLEETLLDPMDYATQVAFETLPILEVWQYAHNGILLKFPD